MLKRIPPAIAYTASVAFEKGLSIITIPLMATFLEPGAYGRYDVAVSLSEFILLTVGLGLSHTLIRFVSTADTDQEQNRCAAELIGTGLMLVTILGLIVQLAVPSLMSALNVSVDVFPLRMLLAAATVSVLVEMPLVWLRLEGQAHLFMIYTMGRAALQALSTWTVLALGYGVSGVMIGNSTIMIAFAIFLIYRQWQLTGATISWRSLQRIRNYGLPLVGSALALFAIGNANRLFLSGHVSDAEIAYFGIASRLGMATALIYFPFDLWWSPQRIRVLNEPGGLEKSAAMWGLGFSILLLSALAVAFAGPTFITVILPKSYHQAADLLPFIVLMQVIQQTGWLSSVGCYARENSLEVLSIDIASAILAITGYLYFVPIIGLWGIIITMLTAFTLRLGLFLLIGRKTAPINYPFAGAAIASVIAALLIYLAPDKSHIFSRIIWSVLSIAAVGTLLHKLDMVQLPSHIREQLLSMVRNVRNF